MTFNDLVTLFSKYVKRTNDVEITQMCGLAEGTTANTIQTTNAIVYTIYNQQVSKAATNNIAMTACAQQAISTSCYYLVSANSAGTVTITKGVDNAFALPSTPAGGVAIAAFKIVTDSAHTFTSGTTDLSSAGISATYYDIDTGIAALLINQAQTRLERGVIGTYNGRNYTLADFDHMVVRDDVSLVQGDTTASLGFTGFKGFVDNGVTITDGAGITTPLEKCDNVPLDTTSQSRPTIISRLPVTETTFTPDVSPTMLFKVWPECDQAYTLNAIAYQYSPALDGVLYSTNWLTENASDVLLFGALVEYAIFSPAETRVEIWKERWNEAVWSLYQAQKKSQHNGGYIKTNFPNPLTSNYTESSILGG
jgi:hypothetical protein